MSARTFVIGVGMTKFAKPGQSEDYHVMASKAARTALEDAKVPYDAVEQVYAGYGDYRVKTTAIGRRIPIFRLGPNNDVPDKTG